MNYDKKRWPEKKAFEIAIERCERAKRYAEMFPDFVSPSDLKFQDIDWQYQNEGISAIKRPNLMEDK